MYKELALGCAAGCVALAAEYPHIIARAGIELRMQRPASKRASDLVLAPVYRGALALYTVLHRHDPKNHRDLHDFAALVWLKEQQYKDAVNSCLQWLREHSDKEVTWTDEDAEMLVHMYDQILGNGRYEPPPDDTVVLGHGDRDWVALGFQGSDPTTDLRSTGRLGLDNFHRFCVDYDESTAVVIQSGSVAGSSGNVAVTIPWYPVALVSIRITGAVRKVLETSPELILKLFGLRQTLETMKARMGDVHARLLIAFHDFWKRRVASGAIRTYFDNEACFDAYEKTLPTRLWYMKITHY